MAPADTHHQYDNLIDGYTRAELRSLGAIEDPHAKESNLQLIHPLYAREKWETTLPRHIAFYPLGKGREGYWKADNDIVWEVLKPCIALASQFLQNIHCSHWWSACMNSVWEIHPSSPDGLKLRRFRARSSAHDFKDRKGLQDAWKLLGKTLTFRICSRYCDPEDGMPNASSNYGVTIIKHGTTKICLAFENLEPLLENMSPSDRIAEQFNVAVILAHETAHALCGIRVKAEHMAEGSEPYYEYESLAEAGYSLTTAILGGNRIPVIRHKGQRTQPSLGVFLTEWPSFTYIRSHSVCLDPELENRPYNQYPITIKHMSNLQQQEYWDNAVHNYGHNAVKPNPTEGRRQYPGSKLSELFYNETQEGPWDLDVAYNPEPRTLEAHIILNAFQKRLKRLNSQETTPPAVDIPPPPPSDPIFSSVLNIIRDNSTSLALDTQLWLPIPLFLSYLNSLPVCATNPISFTLLELFIRSCHAHEEYFRYKPKGSGLIFPIRESFPTISRPRTAQPLYDEEGELIQPRFAERVVAMWTQYLQSDRFTGPSPPGSPEEREWPLADIDADLLYSIFLGDGSWDGPTSRESFDKGMAWEIQEGDGWRYAPEGLYRRVRPFTGI